MEGLEHSTSKKSEKIVVTGGAGYLGAILVPMLLEQGHSVHVIDKMYFGDEGLKDVRDNPNLKITEIDMAQHENIPDLFDGVSTVMHLASISNDPSGDLDTNLTIETNFLSTISLARRAKQEGVKRFIFNSSCSVYGASQNSMLDEHSPIGPVTLYALSKLQCENSLLPMADANFCVTCLRFATLFGYSKRMRFDLAINAMIKKAIQGQGIILNGDGMQYRPFLHVKDAARSIITVMEADATLVNKGVFNVGRKDLNFRIKDLVSEIQSFFPESKVDHIPANNDKRSYFVKSLKFETTCNFQPQYTIKDCVAEIKEACEKGELTNMDDEKYYNVVVMKKILSEPSMTTSPALLPMWKIEDDTL